MKSHCHLERQPDVAVMSYKIIVAITIKLYCKLNRIHDFSTSALPRIFSSVIPETILSVFQGVAKVPLLPRSLPRCSFKSSPTSLRFCLPPVTKSSVMGTFWRRDFRSRPVNFPSYLSNEFIFIRKIRVTLLLLYLH